MIVELHNKTKKNIGDFYCNPSRYFNFPEYQSKRLNNRHVVTNKILVIGGGGLIHKHFSYNIQSLLDQKPKASVLWGVGHNSKGYPATTTYYPDWTKRFDLVGIRDWMPGHYDSYLPCVSCMHPAFNKKYKTQTDVVFYLRTNPSTVKYQDDGVNIMKNSNQNGFDKIIKFLGSAQTIVTDSYHGAYWGQLLGKDVRLVNWSIKMNHMKVKPTLINSIEDWKLSAPSEINLTHLKEARDLNKIFYQKFLNLINYKISN